MKSVKPGRGISELGRSGSVFAIIFGVLWTVIAAAIGIGAFGSAGGIFAIIGFIFPLFGILFIAMAVKQAKFHKHNATAEDRHSIVDITDSSEEGDPFAKYDRNPADKTVHQAGGDGVLFCSNCGHAIDGDDNFCPKCGNRVR